MKDNESNGFSEEVLKISVIPYLLVKRPEPYSPEKQRTTVLVSYNKQLIIL